MPPAAPSTSGGDAGIRRSVHAAVNPPSVTFPPPVTSQKFQKAFRKERLQAADGGAPRASRRAFGRAGFDKIWRDFSVVQHASASRHGGAPAAGLAASRHPRRHRQQLHRCLGPAACASALPHAWPVSLSRPKCWQHGVVRHVEPSWDQGARAESARNGHSRPRTGTAVARARGGPPASPGSEASRGSICVSLL